jgi:hypothetical protein
MAQAVPGLPPYRARLDPSAHGQTSALSNNKWRSAMKSLLSGDNGGLPAHTRDKLCYSLRHDYRCFGYTPDRVCENATLPGASEACPVSDGVASGLHEQGVE